MSEEDQKKGRRNATSVVLSSCISLANTLFPESQGVLVQCSGSKYTASIMENGDSSVSSKPHESMEEALSEILESMLREAEIRREEQVRQLDQLIAGGKSAVRRSKAAGKG